MQPKKLGNRKRKGFADDHDNHQMVHDESNWLVSYADMMTLLFGFFVLMYSFSKLDQNKFNSVRENLTTYFGGKIEEDTELKEMKDDIKQIMGEVRVDANEFDVSAGAGSLILKLNSDLVFASGSAEISAQFKPILQETIKTLMGKKTIEQVSVEGHTDSVPMSSFLYPSNWELSTARSSRVVRELIGLGMEAKILTAQGFGASRPLVNDRDKKGKFIKDNLKKNRRVVIKVDFGRDVASATEAIESDKFIKDKKKKPQQQKKANPGEQQAAKTVQQPVVKRETASREQQPVPTAEPEKGNVSAANGETPMDLLKERLVKAQKDFEETARKVKEQQKEEAARQKMLEKIKQLEEKTQQLQETSDQDTPK